MSAAQPGRVQPDGRASLPWAGRASEDCAGCQPGSRRVLAWQWAGVVLGAVLMGLFLLGVSMPRGDDGR